MTSNAPPLVGAQPAQPPADTSVSRTNTAMAPSAHAPPSSAPTEPQPSTQQRQEELPRRPDSPDLPKPHTAVTPGPRATRLQEIFASSLSHTLARISWENVAACYPTVAARAPTLLRSVQRQVVDGLNEQSNREFQRILEARNVVALLNELEALVADATRRRDAAGPDATAPTPPHTLPPDKVLAAHLSAPLRAHADRLRAELAASRKRNAELAADVERQRSQLAAVLADVERAAADIVAAGEALRNGGEGGDGVDAIAAETRSVDVEMRMT